jgi:hypothetical protein
MATEPPTLPLSSLVSASSPPAFDPPQLPPSRPQSRAAQPNRKSPRTDDEKLDLVTQYLREELYWNLGDLVRALAGAQGSVNTRRKATFAEAAYQDSNVLKTFLRDSTRQWTATSRKHIIEQLSIGGIYPDGQQTRVVHALPSQTHRIFGPLLALLDQALQNSPAMTPPCL